MSIDSLFYNPERVKNTNFKTPSYQRNYVWDDEKASFIESSQIVETEGYITAERVKNALNGIGTKATNLLRLFQEHNEEFEKRIGVNRVYSTYYLYNTKLCILFQSKSMQNTMNQ